MKSKKFNYLTGCLILFSLAAFSLVLLLIFSPNAKSLSRSLVQDFILDSTNYKVYPTSEIPSDFYGRVYAKTRLEPVKMDQASELEEASQKAGFGVLAPNRYPDAIPPFDTYILTEPVAYQVQVDFTAAQQVLQVAGISPHAIPDDLPLVQVRTELPSGVVANCEDQPRWLTLIQGHPAEVASPAGLDLPMLDELGILGMQYLGLTPLEARKFIQAMSWTWFLVLPPADMDTAELITINGQPGIALHSTQPGVTHQAVLWQTDGIMYGLYGGLSTSELITTAESFP